MRTAVLRSWPSSHLSTLEAPAPRLRRNNAIGGVHFVAATDEAQPMCRPIGDSAFEFVDRHIKGRVQ